MSSFDLPHYLPTLVGAHYFGGWFRGPYSHWTWPTPGGPAWIDNHTFSGRVPLLGNYTTDRATIVAELALADTALDFFDVLWYDPAIAGTRPECAAATDDPNLKSCLNTALAHMLSNDSTWPPTPSPRLHFYITYSNDADRSPRSQAHRMFCGPAGLAKWDSFSSTWLQAMRHPRYLRINGRPVFKILIPLNYFTWQCGGNATLAVMLIDRLRARCESAGLGELLVGGGWLSPGRPNVAATATTKSREEEARHHLAGTPDLPRDGYVRWNATAIECCTAKIIPNASIVECAAACNASATCAAFTSTEGGAAACELKNSSSPGVGCVGATTYVKVAPPPPYPYDFGGTYNAAIPVCPATHPTGPCARFKTIGSVVNYSYAAAWQNAVRVANHTGDRVPYLPNVIAGFDPRPWHEATAGLSDATDAEWRDALRVAKVQVESGDAALGFPHANGPSGVQPAFSIYAWNEYGEGGILAPTVGDGTAKVDAVRAIFGR